MGLMSSGDASPPLASGTPNPKEFASMPRYFKISFLAGLALLALLVPHSLRAEGDLRKVNHVIIIMQENHSFDNYFGALELAPGSSYHQPAAHSHKDDGTKGCDKNGHGCVDGLTCSVDSAGN